MVNTRWPKWYRKPKFTFSSNFDVKNSIKSSENVGIFQFLCFQGLKWRKHHPFDTFSCSQVFETIQNILFTFFDIFGLILCYFWRQNCLKTWILAFWTTLVNSCWPHVCDMTKYILGACKYLSEVPSPQISCPEMQNSSWGVEKNIFFSLQAVDGITTFISRIFIWKGFAYTYITSFIHVMPETHQKATYKRSPKPKINILVQKSV